MRRPRAEAEAAPPRLVVRQHRLDGAEARLVPKPDPRGDAVGVLLVGVADKIPDAQIVHRMHVAADDGGERPDMGA